MSDCINRVFIILFFDSSEMDQQLDPAFPEIQSVWRSKSANLFENNLTILLT